MCDACTHTRRFKQLIKHRKLSVNDLMAESMFKASDVDRSGQLSRDEMGELIERVERAAALEPVFSPVLAHLAAQDDAMKARTRRPRCPALAPWMLPH